MRELDKVIGYKKVKEELFRILDILNNKDKYEALGVESPQGILFDGAPGIGKTLMAQCFIKESNRKTYTIRKDKPDGEFVNYIKQAFEEAQKNTPSIVFLDDMDKFANEDSYHRDAEEYVTVQSCIDDIKGKDVFVIATTNSSRDLPDSLLRSGRFDRVFRIRFPENEDAQKIIEYYLSNKKVSCDVDFEEISKFCRGYSCADLEKVINEAGLYAAYDGNETISQRYIIDACLRNFYKTIDNDNVDLEHILRRAVHEAGHVVVSEILDEGSVDFASINASRRREDVGGVVSRNNTGKFGLFKYEEIDIQISLAGKAATEIVLGEIDMGANSDMHNAFDSTRALLDDNTAYDFNSWCHGHETSTQIYDHLDIATGVEVSRYYQKTKRLLIENRRFLDCITDCLVTKRTISYKDIALIKESIYCKETSVS